MPVLPSFDELPLAKDGPPGNAWGLFGPKDALGMLNLLTPEVVREAAVTEIREGIRFVLDWPLDKPSVPTFGRKVFHHAVEHHKAPTLMNDDVVSFNTQSSTQWDGFRHYPYQKSGLFFNNHSQADIESSDALGIDVWAQNGGIVGRGVLLDWASWAERNHITYDPFRSEAIKLEHLEHLVKEENVQFRDGDILFIRCGFARAYNALTPTERLSYPDRKPGGLLGVEATKDSLRWLWEHHFAAVAGDSPSFERGSALDEYNDPDVTLHQWLLAGWGMPIGEMFNLEELAAHCKKTDRYSFFLSSVPLHVPGGVASPPNAVAIF